MEFRHVLMFIFLAFVYKNGDPKVLKSCENSYVYTNLTRKSWLNPTMNRFHANYHPYAEHYRPKDVVKFSCSDGNYLKGAFGLYHAESVCLSNGRWSKEWPMCKGNTCNRLQVTDGIVNDEEKPLPPGTVVHIKCWPGYFLLGENQSVCTSRLQWTGQRECLKLPLYKKRCSSAKMTFVIGTDGEPKCYGKPNIFHDSSNSQDLILGISLPSSATFVIFLVVGVLYVRKVRLHNFRMAIIHYQNTDQTLTLVLPSYEDTIRSKPKHPPPSFEEVFPILHSSIENSSTERRGLDENTMNTPPPNYEDS